jgi:hypothetical protein
MLGDDPREGCGDFRPQHGYRGRPWSSKRNNWAESSPPDFLR